MEKQQDASRRHSFFLALIGIKLLSTVYQGSVFVRHLESTASCRERRPRGWGAESTREISAGCFSFPKEIPSKIIR